MNSDLYSKYLYYLHFGALFLILLDYGWYLFSIYSISGGGSEFIILPSGGKIALNQSLVTGMMLTLSFLKLLLEKVTHRSQSTISIALKSFVQLLFLTFGLAVFFSSYSSLGWPKNALAIYVSISSLLINIILFRGLIRSQNADKEDVPTTTPPKRRLVPKVYIVRKPDGTVVKRTKMIDPRKKNR